MLGSTLASVQGGTHAEGFLGSARFTRSSRSAQYARTNAVRHHNTNSMANGVKIYTKKCASGSYTADGKIVVFVVFDVFQDKTSNTATTDSTTDSDTDSSNPEDGATEDGATEDGTTEDGDGTMGAICGDRSAYMSYTVVMLTVMFDAFVDSLENMIALEQLAAKRSMWFI